ncbi:MAG: DUF2207 family protein [bacterium]
MKKLLKLSRKRYFWGLIFFGSFQNYLGSNNQILWGAIVGGSCGILLLLYDVLGSLRDNKRKPSPCDLELEELSQLQLGVIFHENKKKIRNTLIAQIVKLAVRKKIKIIGDLKSKLKKYRKAEIRVKVLDESGLTSVEQKIVKQLKEEPKLKKILKTDDFLEEITEDVKEELKKEKLFSAANLQIKKRVALSSLIFFIPGLGLLFWGLLSTSSILTGLGIFSFFLGLSRLIKVMTIPVLSEEGLYIKNCIRELLDEKKEKIEVEIAHNPQKGTREFLQELPFIMMHPKFGRRTLHNYRKEVKQVSEIELPEWLELKSGAKTAAPGEIYTALIKGIIYG